MEAKWKYIGLTVALGVLIVAAAVSLMPRPEEKGADDDNWVGYSEPVKKYVGGKFNTTIVLMARLGEYESGDILYSRGGVEHKGYYVSAFNSAFNYIKANTPIDAVVLAWWDYGNMIIGYGEREAIATKPSKRLLIGVTNASENVETDPEERVQDIATALTTTDPKETADVMRRYGSEYVFVPVGTFGDEGKAKWIFYSSGLSLAEVESYWVDGKIIGKGVNTVLYKMLNEMNIQGFRLIYSDKDTRVYQLVS